MFFQFHGSRVAGAECGNSISGDDRRSVKSLIHTLSTPTTDGSLPAVVRSMHFHIHSVLQTAPHVSFEVVSTSVVNTMPSTLSNSDGTDAVALNKLQPLYSDKEPIIWSRNPAHVDGILFECNKYYKRTRTVSATLQLKSSLA